MSTDKIYLFDGEKYKYKSLQITCSSRRLNRNKTEMHPTPFQNAIKRKENAMIRVFCSFGRGQRKCIKIPSHIRNDVFFFVLPFFGSSFHRWGKLKGWKVAGEIRLR